MKRLFYASCLFSAVASALCYGQTAIAEAKIPFAFHLGSTLMPAGHYIISESTQGLLVFRARDAGGPTAMLLSLPTERSRKSSYPSLQFERYGNEYFLADIWYVNSQQGRALSKSKQEQELARRTPFNTTEQIALRTSDHSTRDLK